MDLLLADGGVDGSDEAGETAAAGDAYEVFAEVEAIALFSSLPSAEVTMR